MLFALLLAATLSGMGCGAPDVCDAKAEYFRHCRKEAVLDDQITLCQQMTKALGCSSRDLEHRAEFYSCAATDCLNGASIDQAGKDCLQPFYSCLVP